MTANNAPNGAGALASAVPGGGSRHSRSVAEFVALAREPITPYVCTIDGRSVLLAPGSTLLEAGPSGVGKSLAAYDLAAQLAGPEPGVWLGLRVVGGLRVLLVPFEGEGSDEDVKERLQALALDRAPENLFVWDRWRCGSVPHADDDGTAALAREVRAQEIDVVLLDTGPAFFSGQHDVTRGIPEEAHAALERVRDLAERPVAFVLPVHTRKADRRAAAREIDELEEIAGTFVKKADAAIVLRKDGEHNTPRRRVTFAKCRRGPEPESVIAAFPGRDSDEPPRLTVLTDLGGAAVKQGTEAAEIAEWIRGHNEPVTAAVVRVRFDLSESTLRRRADQLEPLGIKRAAIPGRGRAQGYGSETQWVALLGTPLSATEATS